MKIILSFNFSETCNRFGAQDWGINYVVGLSRLGHEVYLIEEVRSENCYDSNYKPVGFKQWAGKRHFEQIAKSLGLWRRSCLIYNGGEATHGMSLAGAIAVAKRTDLLVNFSGRLKTPEILEPIPCRAYIDRNVGTEQVYNAVYGIDYGFDNHHHFFTYGLNLGTKKCEIPTCGRKWIPMMIPVVLDLWPRANGSGERFTTITGWGGRETFDLKGKYSGEKVDEWKKFITLPKKTSQELEIALDCDPRYRRDFALLKKNGWNLRDTKQFRSVKDYRRYIANSKAEFTTAHAPFVQFRLGWCGDRMTRYAASGKPVLVQSTGIEDHIPTGKGFLTFTTMEEAVDAIEAINKDYPSQCRAARSIAEEYFDSDKVLSKMLRNMGFTAHKNKMQRRRTLQTCAQQIGAPKGVNGSFSNNK